MVAVELEPVPAMTGTRPAAASMTTPRTASSSSWVMVELSPVVPRVRMASVPLATCHSTSSRSFSKFTEPSAWKGVMRATMEPFRLRMSIVSSSCVFWKRRQRKRRKKAGRRSYRLCNKHLLFHASR